MKVNMNQKLNWIVIKGGLGWGIPFALFFAILRWIENKPMAFGSPLVLLLVSIVGGMFWGALTYKICAKNPQQDFSLFNVLRSMLYLVIALLIYAISFHYVLVPKQLDDSLWSSALLIGLMFITLWLQKRFSPRQK